MKAAGSWVLPDRAAVFGHGATRRSSEESRMPSDSFWLATTIVVNVSGGCNLSRSNRYVRKVTATLSTSATLARISIRVRFMITPHAVVIRHSYFNKDYEAQPRLEPPARTASHFQLAAALNIFYPHLGEVSWCSSWIDQDVFRRDFRRIQKYLLPLLLSRFRRGLFSQSQA
jgi:hypothetical protein